MTIKEFKGEYAFLSNMYMCHVVYNGHIYSSVEQAYQANKSIPPDPVILREHNPYLCKRLGKNVKLRPDWDTFKLELMQTLVYNKFANNYELWHKLMNTGDKHLEEGNYWNDTYWGVCRGEGQNHLGIILMQVRALLNNHKQ